MIQLIYIDLFCGGGGTTTGVHRARHEGEPCAIVAACINHDHNAIRSHKSNHKQTLHFTEDITLLYNTGRMTRLIRHVEWLKAQYPDAEVVLWAPRQSKRSTSETPLKSTWPPLLWRPR